MAPRGIQMTKNLIILTHGWTGSSVFTALAERAGYWTGIETVKKIDYDTYENRDLVRLNQQIMKVLGYEGNYEREFSFASVQGLAAKALELDPAPYREFVERCNEHRPWVWKDPRLTFTIRVWEKIFPASAANYLILTRNDIQAWISTNLRRHIQTMRFTKEYNQRITESNLFFLSERSLPHLAFEFEDLLLQPEETLEKLNFFLGVSLTIEDLKHVYKFQLGRRSRGFKDLVLATLIYLKNYSERAA